MARNKTGNDLTARYSILLARQRAGDTSESLANEIAGVLAQMSSPQKRVTHDFGARL